VPGARPDARPDADRVAIDAVRRDAPDLSTGWSGDLRDRRGLSAGAESAYPLTSGWDRPVHACGPTLTVPTVSLGLASITAPTNSTSSLSCRRWVAVSSRSGS